MRLIDADALKREQMKAFNCEDATKYGNKDAKQQERSYSTIMLYEVSDIIEDTIDNAPTVEERPKGTWDHVLDCPTDNKLAWFSCSNCNAMEKLDKNDIKAKYCWNCGADMRGGGNSGTD